MVELEENAVQSAEVIVTAEQDKTQTVNKMSTVSARLFSAEEAARYAGSRNDPARMAANFAGVSGANDSRNDIIIRGNSPIGILWRLNGLDIPNPNHFGNAGSTGGPISILNNNTLGNSDFVSGAFAADYGNATSGVFDLKMDFFASYHIHFFSLRFLILQMLNSLLEKVQSFLVSLDSYQDEISKKVCDTPF
jgi:hypothetical protein